MKDFPKSIRVTTGDQYFVYDKIQEFFKEIREEINEPKNIPSSFETKINNHYDLDRPTDEKSYMLIYDQKVVAVVTETRDESNYLQFIFFKNLEEILNN